MDTVKVDLDKEIISLLQQFDQPVRQTVQELIVLELYRRGAISSGKAAALLGMDRLAFIQYAGGLGIPYFNMTTEELDAEVQRFSSP